MRIIKSGFSQIDSLIGGFQKGELSVIAGRPGMGKTALLASIALRSSIRHKTRILYVSFGREPLSIPARLLGMLSNISFDRIFNLRVDEHEFAVIKEKREFLDSLEIYHSDTQVDFSFEATFEKLLFYKNRYLIDLIIFDDSAYCLKPPPVGGKLSGQLMLLKETALKLDIPIMFATSLDRTVEIRKGGKKPRISDFGKADLLEKIDKLFLIYRPYYYGYCEDEKGDSVTNLMEIYLVKNCSGNLGEFQLTFTDRCPKVDDINDFIPEFSSSEYLETGEIEDEDECPF